MHEFKRAYADILPRVKFNSLFVHSCLLALATLYLADYARRANHVRLPARGEDKCASNEVHPIDYLFSRWAVRNDREDLTIAHYTATSKCSR